MAIRLAGVDIIPLIRELGTDKSGLTEAELNALDSHQITAPLFLKFNECLRTNVENFPSPVREEIRAKVLPQLAVFDSMPPAIMAMILNSGVLQALFRSGPEELRAAGAGMREAAQDAETAALALKQGTIGPETALQAIDSAVGKLSDTAPGRTVGGIIKRLVDEGKRNPTEPDGTGRGRGQGDQN